MNILDESRKLRLQILEEDRLMRAAQLGVIRLQEYIHRVMKLHHENCAECRILFQERAEDK